jgi:hypothetical protein
LRVVLFNRNRLCNWLGCGFESLGFMCHDVSLDCQRQDVQQKKAPIAGGVFFIRNEVECDWLMRRGRLRT